MSTATTNLKRKPMSRITPPAARPLSAEELHKLDAYWRALNYLAVGQIYLMDNPLLREPLKREHIKPRLLGHWGTSPGLNMLCVHLNRVIKKDDLNMMYIIGPGHGGPSLVAHAYLEGTYSEVYPNISQDEEGMARLFKQFSFPGGIPSHVAPETPGSIHEGGELGYALSHAYGAAFDNPDLIVACVVGDGEAETGPLATGWHGNKFLNPARDGCVLPILHLNGYKIANPCFLAASQRTNCKSCLRVWVTNPISSKAATLNLFISNWRTCSTWWLQKSNRFGLRLETKARQTPGLADDHLPHAKGLDLSAGNRWEEVRGLLAQPPGAHGRHGQARAHSHS